VRPAPLLAQAGILVQLDREDVPPDQGGFLTQPQGLHLHNRVGLHGQVCQSREAKLLWLCRREFEQQRMSVQLKFISAEPLLNSLYGIRGGGARRSQTR